FLGAIGEQHQHTFLLINATQIKYITMLLKRHCAVCTYRIDVIAIKNRQTFCLHLFYEVLAVFYKEVAIDEVVFHVNLNLSNLTSNYITHGGCTLIKVSANYKCTGLRSM